MFVHIGAGSEQTLFFSAPEAPRYVKGLNPGSPKHCGLEIVGGRHLPDDWQGNMLTNDFRGNRVCRFANERLLVRQLTTVAYRLQPLCIVSLTY